MLKNEEKRQYLKDEYLMLQHHIEAFDSRVISIKNWSVTVSMAAIAAAFASHTPIILLVSSISSLIFLIIEGIWKTFQATFYPRSNEIEKYFRGEIKEISPFQIGTSVSLEWKKNSFRIFWKNIRGLHVFLPHLPIILFGIIIYILNIYDFIKI